MSGCTAGIFDLLGHNKPKKMEYKIYIQSEPWNRQVAIYLGDDNSYYTYSDGVLTAHGKDCAVKSKPLITLTPEVFAALERTILEEVERRGGTPGTQYLRGKVEELEKQVAWFKSKI
jgi:hypothetical protein